MKYYAYTTMNYGGPTKEDYEFIGEVSRKIAEETAFTMAIEMYESYAGLHGILGEEEIEEELVEMYCEATEDAIWERKMEEIQQWIEYGVITKTDYDELED